MSDWEFIEVERQERVGIVRFNRPDRMNAFNAELAAELYQALEEFNADPSIGAIVTTGNGRAYSAGADLSARMTGDFTRTQRRTDLNPWTPEFLAVECKPLIAAVNGIALGIGLTSILWYDAIVASTEARFSMRFAAIGLTPEFSSTWSLARVIGIQNAKEMMLTGAHLQRAGGARAGPRTPAGRARSPATRGDRTGPRDRRESRLNAAHGEAADVQRLLRAQHRSSSA